MVSFTTIYYPSGELEDLLHGRDERGHPPHQRARCRRYPLYGDRRTGPFLAGVTSRKGNVARVLAVGIPAVYAVRTYINLHQCVRAAVGRDDARRVKRRV